MTGNPIAPAVAAISLDIVMETIGVHELAALEWPTIDHCGARNILERGDWRFIGAGDWAVVLADQERRLAARICAFEPMSGAFGDMCRHFADNPWLPDVFLDAPLEGGGRITVMDFLRPRYPIDSGDAPAPEWNSSGDAQLDQVRDHLRALDREYRNDMPWWGGLDVKPDHFMTGPDGHAKIVDPLGVDGHALCNALIEDYAAFTRIIPPEQHRYLLQLPHFSQSYAAEQLATIRAALSRVAG